MLLSPRTPRRPSSRTARYPAPPGLVNANCNFCCASANCPPAVLCLPHAPMLHALCFLARVSSPTSITSAACTCHVSPHTMVNCCPPYLSACLPCPTFLHRPQAVLYPPICLCPALLPFAGHRFVYTAAGALPGALALLLGLHAPLPFNTATISVFVAHSLHCTA